MSTAWNITGAELVDALPKRFTVTDRIQGIETDRSAAFIDDLSDPEIRAAFFAGMPPEIGLDRTDGLRVRFEGGDIVHLRPSGNAPEFRCYAETATQARAQDLVTRYLALLRDRLGAS